MTVFGIYLSGFFVSVYVLSPYREMIINFLLYTRQNIQAQSSAHFRMKSGQTATAKNHRMKREIKCPQ